MTGNNLFSIVSSQKEHEEISRRKHNATPEEKKQKVALINKVTIIKIL